MFSKLHPSDLTRIDIIHTLQIMENDWMISCLFLKNNKKIRIVGFGRTKQEALDNFDFECWQEKQYE